MEVKGYDRTFMGFWFRGHASMSLGKALLRAERSGALHRFTRQVTAFAGDLTTRCPFMSISKHHALTINPDDPRLDDIWIWNHQHRKVTAYISINPPGAIE